MAGHETSGPLQLDGLVRRWALLSRPVGSGEPTYVPLQLLLTTCRKSKQEVYRVWKCLRRTQYSVLGTQYWGVIRCAIIAFIAATVCWSGFLPTRADDASPNVEAKPS